jgi:hypothetical protein
MLFLESIDIQNGHNPIKDIVGKDTVFTSALNEFKVDRMSWGGL